MSTSLGEVWRTRKSLVFGGVLAVGVVVVVAMAMTNHIWRERLEKLQTLAGGLAVLAGAMLAHDGQTAAAREAKRKDDLERELAAVAIRLKAMHAALMVGNRAAGMLSDLAHCTRNYKTATLPSGLQRELSCPMPAQLEDAWAHLAILPELASEPLRQLTNFIGLFEHHQRWIGGVKQECSWFRTAHLLKDIYFSATDLAGVLLDAVSGLKPGTSRANIRARFPADLPPIKPVDVDEPVTA